MAKLITQFSDAQTDKLIDLAVALGTDKIGAIERGMLLLTVVLREKAAGNDIAIVRGDNIVKRITGL